MPFEIDFLPVGNGEKSGDAIALRFGPSPLTRHNQTVVVIDGGYTETGPKLVDHIQTHYQTSRVDLVISTHPDADHINGLCAVLEQMDVGRLWLHSPSPAADGADKLRQLANSRDVPVFEPFTGVTAFGGAITVLGPTREYFDSLQMDAGGERKSVVAGMIAAAGAVARTIVESIGFETLSSGGGDVSDVNNSSVVTLFSYDGATALFTGDAGVEALEPVVEQLHDAALAPGGLQFVQIPHHGSRRNVGSDLLDDLLCQQRAKSDPLAAVES